ncbi:MAG: hypothetical protein ABIM89_00545 [Mycobacteriales bacterium]
MVPLPVILVEFLLAFGGALFLANVVAIYRLRREQNWPPYRPAGMSDEDTQGLSRSALRDNRVPSRPRILIGLVIGFGVAMYALASLIDVLHLG